MNAEVIKLVITQLHNAKTDNKQKKKQFNVHIEEYIYIEESTHVCELTMC